MSNGAAGASNVRLPLPQGDATHESPKGPLIAAAIDRPESTPAFIVALPWGLNEPGGVNEVVKNLLRQAHDLANARAFFLQSSYSAIQPSWSRWIDTDSVTIRVPNPWDADRPTLSALSFLARGPAAVFRLATVLSRVGPAALNVHYPGLWALPLLLATRIAAPGSSFVLSFHGSDIANLERAGALERRLWSLLLRKATAITCCSSALRARLLTAARMKLDVTVIHNGVDEQHLTEEIAMADLPLQLRGRRYVVNVGTFERKKGQDLLLDAFARIKLQSPDLHLVLVGRDGPFLETVRKRVRSLGLESSVQLHVDAPHSLALALIRSAQAFVLSSRNEPFGIVLLEASLLGVPVVATAVGGVPEVLRDGESALLVPPEDAAALAAAVQRILNDQTLGEDLARHASERVGRLFTGQAAYSRYLHAMRLVDATPR